jgi:SnoaL-like domain
VALSCVQDTSAIALKKRPNGSSGLANTCGSPSTVQLKRPDALAEIVASSMARRIATSAVGPAPPPVNEALLAPSLTFHAPPDPNLDRAGYFERCWPGSGNGGTFDFARMIESGDEVVVTYNATRKDGSQFRNTEVLTFEGDQVAEIEVYFGWDLE